jgi:hypothetical protein
MRKSVFIALVASSLVVLSGVTVRAGTLWDIDIFYKYLSGQTTSYTGYFDITSKYNPALETVSDAQVWFLVWDDHWDLKHEKEKVVVDLGPTEGQFSGSASFNFPGGNFSGEARAWLDATGKLQYTLWRTEGDFYAVAEKLYLETCPKTVPDGGATLMLLGVALAAIEPLRRRLAKRNAQPRRV